jgi:serine/threonine protein kinase/tetratricopeptide (TPR) repeat protein
MFRWLKKASSPTSPEAAAAIRHYRITRKLGEGGMGVVFEARDERLDRLVAIKRLRSVSGDTVLRERLSREARVAAGVSHPNICQVFELGEDQGELYIVMELLTGSTLAERITRGPLPLSEALQITLSVLSALEVIHGRGVVHRDLKPSNIFLTAHGPKLLDFGVARPLSGLADDPTLTAPGTILGTPRYLAPELLGAEPASPAADIFALGAILFEMLTGKHAFAGSSVLEVAHAVMHEQPPPLAGGPDVVAVDRIIQRALAKRAADRHPDAAAMAREIREALTLIDTGPAPRVRTMTRLIVLPFRVLRPDPEIDFLAYSLPEAITASLSGLETLTVRSSAAAVRFAAEQPDLKAIAAEAGVDVVLLGTLLRAGAQVRVSAQLVETPSGTVVCTRTAQVGLTDIFQLQDELTRQIVDALAIPLSAHDQSVLQHDVPSDSEAYELYLRANHISEGSASPGRLTTARELYCRCLERDPQYAPAWARLGRVHRVIAKYGYADSDDEIRQAEEAFRRALEINPELPLAHNLYTYFEIEELGRAREAMLRLLRMVETRAAVPDLYAGLVVACRFCGLLEASLAADQRARRLDPGVRTSVAYTHWMMGDYEQAMVTDLEDIQALRNGALWMLGRQEEATEGVRRLEAHWPGGADVWYLRAQRMAFEGDRAGCAASLGKVMESGFHDPEGLFFCLRSASYVGEKALALDMLGRVVEAGFHCPTPLVRDPWLDPIRTEPAFVRALRRAEEEHVAALGAFTAAGGERLLGVAG